MAPLAEWLDRHLHDRARNVRLATRSVKQRPGDIDAGKLGALPVSVTSPADPSVFSPDAGHRPADAPRDHALQAAVLSVLCRQPGAIAERWTAQARMVLLLDQEAETQVDVNGLIDVMLGVLASDDDQSDETISQGLRFGSDAFGRGASLHHTMKGLDLLVAMMLFAMESAMDDNDVPTAPAVDGIRLARRVQRRASLLSLAVARGFTQAYGEALRERFRHLRHDLRNPLGTIKNVLALMEDESVPLEARANSNFRAMATRNTRSLEELIADRLSDAAALLPMIASVEASVPAVVASVRRELRDEAERRGVSIRVNSDGPRGHLDASGLELLLRGTIQAVLQDCEPGEQLRVEFGDATADRAMVILSCDTGRVPMLVPSAIEALTALAEQIGASLTASDRVLISVPMRASTGAAGSADRERPVTREALELGGDARHDIRSTRESDHGEAGAY